MHRPLRLLALAACLPLSPVHAGAGSDCWHQALAHLRASAPDGVATYEKLADPGFFKSWIRCDDPQFDLSTAVHESTHVITSETDAFPLVGGGAVALPHEVSNFFPPTRIANRFKPDDFTTIYLRLGKASSSTDFLYLLDELNAYTHDLAAAVDLRDLTSPDISVDHRDGLAALMAFVAVYAETAQAREPETWQGLRQPRVARTIATLWAQAERVMASSCGIPNYGTSDTTYIGRFCTARAQAALTPILERAPTCPTACLTPTLDTAATGAIPDDAEGSHDETAAHRSTAGPSWIKAMIRSKSIHSGSLSTDPKSDDTDDTR